MSATLANGKIYYSDACHRHCEFLELLQTGLRIEHSVASLSLTTTGEASGTWVLGRPHSAKPNLLLTSRSITATLDAIVAN